MERGGGGGDNESERQMKERHMDRYNVDRERENVFYIHAVISVRRGSNTCHNTRLHQSFLSIQ